MANGRQILKEMLDKVGLLHAVQKFRSDQRKYEHQRKLHNLYAQFVRPGDLCFDVGANYGTRSEIFLNLKARAIAIEPQPECIAYLRSHFGDNPQFTLVEGGLGEQHGEQELFLCTNHGTTSMSQDWISHVKDRKKLVAHSWNEIITVKVYTMDDLIQKYGKPAFCKIDVEGFELQVLKGLSQPIHSVSFECTPEFKEPTYHCLDYLLSLGQYMFNYSYGESAEFAFPDWVRVDKIRTFVSEYDPQSKSGDVYAKLV